jgi:predicted aspartyl protease
MRVMAVGILLASAMISPVWAQPSAPQIHMGMQPAPDRSGVRASLPLQLIAGLPTITATINGAGPFRFGIDTGAAGYLRVTPDLALKLGLTQIGEALASDPSGKSPVRLQLFEVATLKFGDLTFSKVPTISLGMTRPGMDGIIGMGFFHDLLLKLDYGRLNFSADPGSLPPANGKDVIDISLDRGVIPTIPVKVGNWASNAHLDTGNTRYPFFVPSSEVAAMPTRGAARAIGTAHTVNQQLTLQAIDLTAPVVIGSTDLGVSSVGFPSAGPQANVGSLALTNMAVTIDSANRRVKVVPSR